MTKDEQINDLAVIIRTGIVHGVSNSEIAEVIYKNDYRKASEVINEIIDILTEVKDDYRLNEEIREACAVRYAIGRVEEKYGGNTDDEE